MHDSALTFRGSSLPPALRVDATIYHSDQWLDALCRYYQYDAAPMTITDNGEIVAYAPLVRIDNFTGRKLRSPPASMYGHLLASTREAMLALTEQMQDRCRNENLRLIVKIVGEQESSLYELSREIDCRVPLGDIGTTWDNLHSSARRAIRKSAQHGVTVSAEGPDSLKDFVHLLATTRKRLGLPLSPRGWLRQLLESGHAGLMIARYNATPVAGVLYLADEQYVHYALPGYSDVAMKVHAMDACIWQLIKTACESGRRWLGMGGSPEQNEGLRRFKKKWGGKERLVRLVTNQEPQTMRSRKPKVSPRLLTFAPARLLEAVGYLYLRHLQ